MPGYFHGGLHSAIMSPMDGVLHVSFRVNDPQRSAELFVDLLDMEIFRTPLEPLGVVCVARRGERQSWLMDMLEFWPADKHWDKGKLVRLDPHSPKLFGHIAFVSGKSYEELARVAEKHGVEIRREERGMSSPVPVIYDECGNYFEFFPAQSFEGGEDPAYGALVAAGLA